MVLGMEPDWLEVAGYLDGVIRCLGERRRLCLKPKGFAGPVSGSGVGYPILLADGSRCRAGYDKIRGDFTQRSIADLLVELETGRRLGSGARSIKSLEFAAP
jgi:hypothetical protein